VIWPKLYERQRRVILSARMLAVHGASREGEVVTRRPSGKRFIEALASVGHRTPLSIAARAVISFITAARARSA